MSVCPRDIFKLVQHLFAEPNNDEATQRTIISRAYYAALLETETTFDQPKRMGSESSHKVIIDGAVIYGKGPNPGRELDREIAKFLAKMKTARNRADYQLDADVTADDAKAMVGYAQAVLQRCDEILQRRMQPGSVQVAER